MLQYPHMVYKQNEKDMQKLGDNLRNVREKAGLTQAEVAEKAGMKANYYAKIERGEINTSFDKLMAIKRALKAKSSEIFPD